VGSPSKLQTCRNAGRKHPSAGADPEPLTPRTSLGVGCGVSGCANQLLAVPNCPLPSRARTRCVRDRLLSRLFPLSSFLDVCRPPDLCGPSGSESSHQRRTLELVCSMALEAAAFLNRPLLFPLSFPVFPFSDSVGRGAICSLPLSLSLSLLFFYLALYHSISLSLVRALARARSLAPTTPQPFGIPTRGFEAFLFFCIKYHSPPPLSSQPNTHRRPSLPLMLSQPYNAPPVAAAPPAYDADTNASKSKRLERKRKVGRGKVAPWAARVHLRPAPRVLPTSNLRPARASWLVLRAWCFAARAAAWVTSPRTQSTQCPQAGSSCTRPSHRLHVPLVALRVPVRVVGSLLRVRPRTAPKVVLCFWDPPYCRTLRRCVSG